MKIGIITFHAAHNFGSMLQAYALSTFMRRLNSDTSIINYRTENQKDIYSVFTKRRGLKYLIKNAYALLDYRRLREKNIKFEAFLREQLKCSEEHNCPASINSQNFDVIVSGSDQIWNIDTNDFEWVYLLDAIEVKKKCSYAASCGPSCVTITDRERITKALNDYEAISVRDNTTKQFVENHSEKTAQVVCDPVFLLDRDEWHDLAEEIDLRLPQKYIFFYTLSCSKRMKQVLKQISKSLQMPVVIPHHTNQHDLFMKAKRCVASGPVEFMHLMKNASVVVTSSFHAMLFSVICNKPFFVIDGMKDNRKKDFLKEYGLEKHSIDGPVDLAMIQERYESKNNDFSSVAMREQRKGIEFIRRNIFHENL